MVTVCKNEGPRLEETFKSVIMQKYPNVEHIVIDGESTDSSVDILKKYKDNFSVFISEKDGGVYDAQNKGLSYVTGEFVIFLNGGDFFYSEKSISYLVDQADEEVMLVLGNLVVLNSSVKKKEFHRLPKRIGLEFMLGATVWHPSSMINTEFLRECGGYSLDFKICSDYNFFLQAICIKEVKYRLVDQFISCFWGDGIGTRSEFEELRNKERALIQKRLFPLSVLDLVCRYNKLRGLLKPLVLLSNFLERVKCQMKKVA